MKTSRIFTAAPAFLLLFALLCALFSGCSMLDITPDSEVTDAAAATDDAGLLQSSAEDSVFSVNYDSQGSLNPFLTTSSTNLLFLPLIYDCLFDVDESYAFSPNLITDYSSSDGVTWFFSINTSRTFHNGSALTASDAVYSVQRAMRSSLYSARLSIIGGISVVDESSFAVTLLRANLLFPALLNIPVIPDGSIDEPSPSGTGPYKLSADYSRLELYEDHPLAADMPVDTVYLKEYGAAAEVIAAFEDSLIDIVTNDPNGINSLGYGSANETRYCSTTNMHYLGYNLESAFFSAAERRAAMTYAVDRASIVTDIMDGCATASSLPVSPLYGLYSSGYAALLDYDGTDKLESALESAGISDYDDDGAREYMITGIPMEISLKFIVCSDSSAKVSAARDIAEKLTAAGVSVTLRELSWDDYYEALDSGDFDLYYGEVRLSADFDLSCLLTYGGSANYSRSADLLCDSAISDYLSADDENRQRYCDLMCKAVAENAPITPVCFERRQILTHRGAISGISATQYNVFNKFQDWTITLS